MVKTKMSDDDILYCLVTLASYEPDDMDCDDFEIAVNDGQFGQMSIVRTAELAVGLIKKLQSDRDHKLHLLHHFEERCSYYDEKLREGLLVKPFWKG